MLTSCLVVVVVGNNLVGGSGVVFQKSYEAGRIEIFNFDLSPLTRHTFWSQVRLDIILKYKMKVELSLVEVVDPDCIF